MRTLQVTALVSALLSPALWAAPVTFSAIGTFENGAVLSGSLTIDTATGSALSGDLAVSGIPTHFTTLGSQITFGAPPPLGNLLQFKNGQATNNTLVLLFEPASLVGFGGGSLCGLSPINCPDPGNFAWVTQYFTLNTANTTVNLQSGTLTPAVPEPASLLLAGAALLALGWKHRRLRPR